MSSPASPSASRRIRAVGIDLDGTLLDTADEIAVAVNAMLAGLPVDDDRSRSSVPPASAAHGAVAHRLSDDEIRAMIGQGLAVLVEKALTAVLGRPPEAAVTARAFALCQDAYFDVLGTSAAPFPGVREGLDALQRMGLPLACITNKPTRFTLPLLGRTGLEDRFGHVVCGDTYERKKPDPLPLVKTAERFGCLASELLMIGDSIHDVAAARAAGCPVVTVPYGYDGGEPVERLDADGMIRDLSEAPAWIRRWNARRDDADASPN